MKRIEKQLATSVLSILLILKFNFLYADVIYPVLFNNVLFFPLMIIPEALLYYFWFVKNTFKIKSNAFFLVFIANIVSTIPGIFIPVYTAEGIQKSFYIVYIVSFIISIIIESIIYIIYFKKEFKMRIIIFYTTIMNIASYALLSLAYFFMIHNPF